MGSDITLVEAGFGGRGKKDFGQSPDCLQMASGKLVSSGSGMSVLLLSVLHTPFQVIWLQPCLMQLLEFLCSPNVWQLFPSLLPWAEILFRIIFPLPCKRIAVSDLCSLRHSVQDDPERWIGALICKVHTCTYVRTCAYVCFWICGVLKYPQHGH